MAERLAEDCLLLPNSGADLQSVDKLADTAVTAGTNDPALAYFLGCKAMSDYRQGRFAEAIDWAGRAAGNPLGDAEAKAKACAILAMADWQIGKKDAAQAMLTRGNQLAPGNLHGNGNISPGESWVAWLIARISLDEATELIRRSSTSNGRPNRP